MGEARETLAAQLVCPGVGLARDVRDSRGSARLPRCWPCPRCETPGGRPHGGRPTRQSDAGSTPYLRTGGAIFRLLLTAEVATCVTPMRRAGRGDVLAPVKWT